MVSRAIDLRLKWHNNNQDTIFGGELHKQDVIKNYISSRIISISSRIIEAELLDGSKRIVLIPRIRFKFKLKYGESYQIMR